MAIGTGVQRQLRVKKEVTWGTAPGTGSAYLLRRVQHSLQLAKNTFQSNEIRSNYQISDFRHGMRRVEGGINGELSPGTFEDFFAAASRRDFTSLADLTGLSLTVAASGTNYTITRSAGDYLAAGIKAGMIVRVTAGLNAASLNKNIRVVSVTATIITGDIDGGVMTIEGPIAACTIVMPGKRTYVPITAHTNDSFYIEDWHSVVLQSERYAGCRVSQVQCRMPPSGMATADFSFMGKDMTTAGAEYYVAPTAELSTGVVAANNGQIRVGSNDLVVVTGLDFTINGNHSTAEVIGANTTPDVFPGRVMVSGQFTAMFEDGTMRDAFINETEVAIVAYVKADGLDGGDFMSFVFPRCKLGSANLDDGDKGLVRTYTFQALYNSVGGAGVQSEQTTFWMQDSQA